MYVYDSLGQKACARLFVWSRKKFDILAVGAGGGGFYIIKEILMSQNTSILKFVTCKYTLLK